MFGPDSHDSLMYSDLVRGVASFEDVAVCKGSDDELAFREDVQGGTGIIVIGFCIECDVDGLEFCQVVGVCRTVGSRVVECGRGVVPAFNVTDEIRPRDGNAVCSAD